jgi:hypothetical protein
VAVTAVRIAWFPSAMVTAEQRGPGSGDDREDGAVPRRGDDNQAAWTQRRWKRSG